MLKNTASQKLTVVAYDENGALLAGDAANLTAYVSIDDGTVTALTDTSATEKDATNAKGAYDFDLTQAETNGTKLFFSAKSSTSGVQIDPLLIYTTGPLQTGDSFARLGAPAGASQAADIAAVKADTAAVKTKTDFLPSVTAGAANGLTIAGTNAATTFATLTVTGAMSINGTGHVAQTGDSFARIGAAGASLTALGDARIANLDATMSSRATAIGQTTLLTRSQKYDTMVEETSPSSGLYQFSSGVGDYMLSSVGLNAIATTVHDYSNAGFVLKDSVEAVEAVSEKLDTMLAASGLLWQFTTDALENAPAGGGGGGGTDWTTGEKEQIRHRLGIDGTAGAPAATPSLASAADVAALSGDIAALEVLLNGAIVTIGEIDTNLDTANSALVDLGIDLDALTTTTGLIKVKTDGLNFNGIYLLSDARLINGIPLYGSGTYDDRMRSTP